MSSSKTLPYSYQFLLYANLCDYTTSFIAKRKYFSFICFYQKENIQELKETMNAGGKQPKIFRFLFCFKTLI